MSATRPNQLPPGAGGRPAQSGRRGGIDDAQRAGIEVMLGIVVVMWLIEVFNTLDHNALDRDGIYARDFGRLWGILTAPFVHASFAHLISNTIPFIFMGVIIALRGARELLMVTAIVIVLGGLGTWLVSPAHVSTIGASGVVFGYAAYLLTRGVFNRSMLELITGLAVAVVWGGALVGSLVPHYGVSWQAHVCGAIAGVLAAWILARQRPRDRSDGGAASGGADGTSALDRALAS